MADETKKPQDTKEAATETKAAAANPKKESKLKETSKPEDGTVVEFSDKIWIEGTGNSMHLLKGKKYEVQRLHGEKLIEKGAAKLTTPPPKVQPKPAGKKANNDDEDDD